MKPSRFFLLLLFLLQTLFITAQPVMPTYIDVVSRFFADYSYDRPDPGHSVYFAKKKNGWHVQIVDYYKDEAVESEQLFWDLATNKYKELTGFGPAGTAEEIEEKITDGLSAQYGPTLYGYSRSPYFGYNEWDADMIRDFGETEQTDPWLLEGLGRAYSYYAERYLWAGFGGTPFDNDPLKSKLSHSEMPSHERITKFIFYIRKAIACYEKLDKIKPGYKMLVGNSKTKMLNEQFHAYQQLMVAGFNTEAEQFLNEIVADDSLYTQIGRAYLSSCPKDAILITFGDNDTYPLWYMQAKKGFRKDVTVINNSLLGFAPYVSRLKQNNQPVFSLTRSFIDKNHHGYFPYKEVEGSAITKLAAATFIRELLDEKYPQASSMPGETLTSYRVKQVDFPIDLVKLRRICNQPNLGNTIEAELSSYMLLSDLVTMDIVNSNIHTRPICFTSTSYIFSKDLQQREAAVFRLLPLDKKKQTLTDNLEVMKAENYLKQNNKPVTARFDDGEDYVEDALYGRFGGLYKHIIEYYIGKNNKAKADEWAQRYVSAFTIPGYRYSLSELDIAETLLKTSYTKNAVQIIENLAINIVNDYRKPSLTPLSFKKSGYDQWLKYLSDLLKRAHLTSDGLQKLIEEFEYDN